jgi:inner membrane protein
LDNVTHTLAGLLLAEAGIAIGRERGRPLSGAARAALRVGSALANNLNDADFLYARRWAGKLGYLLHHRGHTHTLPAALALGVLVFALVLVGVRASRATLSARERWFLLQVCLVGPFVHIAMDFSNNYGVHPFWPFDSRWFYGDTLFIIEPWLWVLAVPPLCGLLESRVLRAALVLSLGFLLILGWFHPLVHWVTALLLCLGAFGCWRLSARLLPGKRLALAGAGWGLLLFVFGMGTHGVRVAAASLSSAEASARGVHEQIVDVVVTPTPANPLCGSALVVAMGAEQYVVRAASVSLAPWLITPEGCHVEPTGFTAGMRRSSLESSAKVQWEGEWLGSLAELRGLERDNCWVSAMLQFARVPFWQLRRGGVLVLGDIRYDRLPGEGFAEVHVPKRPGACPDGVPPWRAPRADLVE